MTDDRLLELAERVEAATGPDLELDAEIARATGLEVQLTATVVAGRAEQRLSVIDRASGAAPRALPVPHFTASLDAAMSLVPEGYDWIIGRTNDGLTIHAEVGGRGDEFMRFGATPALALTAAALWASAIEARRAAAPENDAVHESAVGNAGTPNDSRTASGEEER